MVFKFNSGWGEKRFWRRFFFKFPQCFHDILPEIRAQAEKQIRNLIHVLFCFLHYQEYIDINCKNINSLIPLKYIQLYWVSKLQANQKLNLNHFHKASISCNHPSCKKPLKTPSPVKPGTLRQASATHSSPCPQGPIIIYIHGTGLTWTQSIFLRGKQPVRRQCGGRHSSVWGSV